MRYTPGVPGSERYEAGFNICVHKAYYGLCYD